MGNGKNEKVMIPFRGEGSKYRYNGDRKSERIYWIQKETRMDKETGVGKILLAIALIPIIVLSEGWSLSLLWGWFVSPLFGVPEIGIIHAFGLVTVVQLFKSGIKSSRTESDDSLAWSFTIGVFTPISLAFIGWITQFFL